MSAKYKDTYLKLSCQMMLTDAKKEPTLPMHSFFSNFFCLLSPKKPEKPNRLHVPHTLPPLSSNFERLFRYIDEDGDGKISPAELRSCMRSVGEELSEEDLEAAVMFVDSDGDGLLGFEDFVKLVEVEEEEEEKGRDLREAFGVYELEGEDCITSGSLRGALARLGQPRNAEECEAMIRRFDLDGDGVISFDEFRVMML